jgi:hypothetical protein
LEPPLAAVAVKPIAVESPSHTWLEPDVTAIVQLGTTAAFTFIVIPELVAVGVPAQDALVVMVQVTTSEFASVDEVKEELFVPALVPFTCHW